MLFDGDLRDFNLLVNETPKIIVTLVDMMSCLKLFRFELFKFIQLPFLGYSENNWNYYM